MRHNTLGPWTTSLGAPSNARLSTLWKRRLAMLPRARSVRIVSGRARITILVAILGILALPNVIASRAEEDAADAEPHTTLDGRWEFVSGYDGDHKLESLSMTLADGKFVITHDGEVETGSFRADFSTTPHQIDFIGANDYAVPGIFEFRGKPLVICINEGRGAVRPTSFDAKHDVTLVLRLVDKNASIEAVDEDLPERPDPPAAAAEPQVARETRRESYDKIHALVAEFVREAFAGNMANVEKLLDPERATDRDPNYTRSTQEIVEMGAKPAELVQLLLADDHAMAISDSHRLFQGTPREGNYAIVYFCTRRDGRWLINNIDPENTKGLIDEVMRFLERTQERQ